MKFAYQAREPNGQIRTGEITASDAGEAARQLRNEGLYLLSVQPLENGESSGLPFFRKRVTRAEIIYVTNQLAVMVDSGVPLADAVQGLAQQTANPTLADVLSKIHRDLESGEDFSSALAKYPKYFDRTYVNLIKASEASGTLAEMLDRIATQSRSELETLHKIRGAMIYPAAMLVMCVGVCIFLLTYVFPKLLPLFAGREEEIPKPTRMLIAASEVLRHEWYFVVAAAIALIGLFFYARKQPWGRYALDWMWLNLPIWGTLTRKVAISRSVRTLATTVNAGVPMLEALQLCAGVADNVFYERTWLDVSEKVTGGKQIHEALAGNELFPDTLVQMIASGEKTGKLGYVLEKVADYFDREVANAVKTATSMIEPLMVAVMGSVIGGIALAMLLPVFELSSTVS
ncbi:MAG: type II secretion system F family protein [Planctomycetes bacterium]|nr:type II secretion system F family protein [Planctomycetota bacterium]